MVRAIDCEYVGLDEATGKYHVHEQLYPEARGFIVYEFLTEKLALEWLETLKADEVREESSERTQGS